MNPYPGGPLNEVPEYSSIPAMVDSSAGIYGDSPCMTESGKEGRSITFRGLKALVDDLARGIILTCDNPVVGVVGSNSIHWAAAFLAAIRSGGVVVPIDKALPVNEIHAILHFTRANILFHDESHGEEFRDSLRERKKSIHLVTMNHAEGRKHETLEELAGRGRKKNPSLPEEFDADAPVLISYTSGTMGQAKGVVLSQRNLLSDLRQMLQAVNLSHSEVFLSILPMHHMYECVCGFLCPLSHGCSIIFCAGLKSITDDMSEYRTTIMLGVPLLWESIHRRIMSGIESMKGGKLKFKAGLVMAAAGEAVGLSGARKKLFSAIHDRLGGCMRFLVSGGAGVDPEVVVGFEKLGFTFLQGYGLTECSPILAVNRDTANRAGSVGPPLPQVEVRIDDPDETGVGEILAKGPNVMIGYHDNPEDTQKVFTDDGWFRTGDYGYLDEDGFLFITGRKKNIIIAKNGKNIYPEELEQVLNRSKYLMETMVFGRASRQKGEEVWVIVVPDMDLFISGEESDGERISPESLRGKVREEISRVNSSQPHYRRISRFIIRSTEFPKTTTRKIRRQEALKEAGLEQETAFKV
ncbi:MAG: AMP-binding protein [Candidatus Aegiribacteria sp.]